MNETRSGSVLDGLKVVAKKKKKNKKQQQQQQTKEKPGKHAHEFRWM